MRECAARARGSEGLYENGKEALVDGGYRQSAAQTRYSAGDSPSHCSWNGRGTFMQQSRDGDWASVIVWWEGQSILVFRIVQPSLPLLLSSLPLSPLSHLPSS